MNKFAAASPKAEPAVWVGAVVAVLAAVLPRVLHLSPSEWERILAAAPIVAGVVTRFHVSPSRDLADVVVEALAQAEQAAQDASGRLDDLRSAFAVPQTPAPPVLAVVQADPPIPAAETTVAPTPDPAA